MKKNKTSFDTVLAIIPARGGSKRLRHKNTLTVGGIPLAKRAILTAKSAGLTKIIVTTDDPKVKEIALKEDIVVIDRPEELATDDISGETLAICTADYINKNKQFKNWDFDTVVLLQCTSPLLESDTLKKALDTFINNQSLPALIAVSPSFKICGAFYIIKKNVLLTQKTLYPESMGIYVVSWEEAQDIDYLEDWRICQAINDCKQFQEVPLG